MKAKLVTGSQLKMETNRSFWSEHVVLSSDHGGTMKMVMIIVIKVILVKKKCSKYIETILYLYFL